MVMGSLRRKTEVAVIGAGPGGYVAALRAADLGKEVTLIEARERPGGVCLIEGCIPSKTLINAVELVESAREAKRMGVTFKDVAIDLEALRKWKETVVTTLTKGISGLLDRRGVDVVHGRARFENSHALAIDGGDVTGIDFENCIIATGSDPIPLPLESDPGLWNSTDALAVPEIPEHLLVVGGGYIGFELGLVYAGLGSKVTVVEFLPTVLSGVDEDLLAAVLRRSRKKIASILLESKVVGVEKTSTGFAATIDQKGEKKTIEADKILVSIGRRPSTGELALANTGVVSNRRGFIEIDRTCRTNDPHIFAIGDVTEGPMLAHRASRQAKVAAEVIAGKPSAFDNRVVPGVIFTDPEIATVGLTEREATEKEIQVKIGRFPLAALGRARTLGRTEGLAKVLADPETDRVLGVGIAAPHASELIAEAALAIEMGATLEDLMVTIHPHPTLSESVMEAAEAAAGEAVHINPQP